MEYLPVLTDEPHGKAIAMHNILPLLVAASFLAACSSSGDVVDVVDMSENYEGLHAAAVAPVADHRPGRRPLDERLRSDIQRSIQQQLDRSGIFAHVVSLERPDEGNEAEVIIEPTLVGSDGYGGGDVELDVRVSEKTQRRTVLKKTYEAGGGRANALNVAVSELEEDLEDRYGK
jgi:hypothetical protein